MLDDLNSPLLSVAPLPLNPPDSNDLSTQAKISLILEAEHDIRSLERDLRDMETLNQRGVVEAGKLPGASVLGENQMRNAADSSLSYLAEHEALKAPLKQLEKDAKPAAAKYASLEARTNTLLRNYNDHVNSNSTISIEGTRADHVSRPGIDHKSIRALRGLERSSHGSGRDCHKTRERTKSTSRHFLNLLPSFHLLYHTSSDYPRIRFIPDISLTISG